MLFSISTLRYSTEPASCGSAALMQQLAGPQDTLTSIHNQNYKIIGERELRMKWMSQKEIESRMN